ncbi:SLC13 family permease [Falsirhodobacter algicola]|uniref:SLC13 family permease n=1 Tax=Falsirhodobacter algicola TaxID=2692330 RepID=A0A8J8SLR0_9RHOB|nr:SLC13 family permease [Falsirhodobacter algicola]QUS36808.1 SLC13 family permease [Falsirhodobacter algicola]
MLELSPEIMPWAAIAIILVMLVLFVAETFPVEVTAIGGAALMLVLGILPISDAASVLSNNAPWTIALMFIVVGALVRTGTLDSITHMANTWVATHPAQTVGVLGVLIVCLSAVVNNTPVVVVFLPVFMQLAQTMKIAPSKLLIPLSYLSIMGGTVTLVGTSTNLVVDGVARGQGLEPFGIFEITPVGIPIALVGMIYLGLFGRWLLPSRDSMSTLLGGRSKMKFFTEVAIAHDSALVGTPVLEADLFKRAGVRVIDVLRGDMSLRRDLTSVVLAPGDRVVLRTPMQELLSFQDHKDLTSIDKLSSVATSTVEVLITPGCRLIGRRLSEMRLRRRYGVYVLAAHRRNQNIGRQLDDLVVAVGDTLLLEGRMEDIQRLASDMDMVDLTQPTEKPFRRKRAPIVVAVLAGIVLLSSFNVAPIEILAFIGVAIVLLTRCIDADEAFASIDGRLLGMLFGMIAVGQGMDHSGAVELIVKAAQPFLGDLPGWALIFCVYALTSLLTELLSNNAVAVVVTPVAIGLAQGLGLDARPILIAVMLGASFGFATPIGYQCNLLVYGPGGYTFGDFLRIGVPLNVLMGIVASIVIPLLYSL